MNIHNFRSFQHQKLNFSKVNILIGENSGGKSSLLKLLLALKQTLDSPNEVNLKLKGDFTDLGNYEEVVYNRKKTSKISISFENNTDYFNYFFDNAVDTISEKTTTKELKSIKKIIGKCVNATTEIQFEFTSKLDDHITIKTKIKNDKIGELIIIQNKNTNDKNRRELSCDLEFNLGETQGVLKNCVAFKEGFFTFVAREVKDECKKQFDTNYEHVFYSIAYLLIFQNYIATEIGKIVFVNPIDTSPKRFYYQEDKKMSYKVVDIEKFINIIGDPTLTNMEKEHLINLLNNILKTFGIAEEIQIIKDKSFPILALNVKINGLWSNIKDVGYGVSLQIPVLFQALLSEELEGETILIEQPEIHLHPALQAKFIETLLGIGNKNTYFIETHSEHIIRKLQILVKEGRFGLKPEDISIHYFKREPSKFEITEHKILENGKLSPPFPSGFFDVSYSLVKELL